MPIKSHVCTLLLSGKPCRLCLVLYFGELNVMSRNANNRQSCRQILYFDCFVLLVLCQWKSFLFILRKMSFLALKSCLRLKLVILMTAIMLHYDQNQNVELEDPLWLYLHQFASKRTWGRIFFLMILISFCDRDNFMKSLFSGWREFLFLFSWCFGFCGVSISDVYSLLWHASFTSNLWLMKYTLCFSGTPPPPKKESVTAFQTSCAALYKQTNCDWLYKSRCVWGHEAITA